MDVGVTKKLALHTKIELNYMKIFNSGSAAFLFDFMMCALFHFYVVQSYINEAEDKSFIPRSYSKVNISVLTQADQITEL
jgi:hypothetical protein